LVRRRTERRNRAKETLYLPGQPIDLWRTDYKGEFLLADRRNCYPLTITGFASARGGLSHGRLPQAPSRSHSIIESVGERCKAKPRAFPAADWP